ncbi:CHAT domain-containing protein [Streptomyces sp. LHD-70]|uniref:CHAT domain-containing protein n=1 Tax=Streptomyces sp. LHD-70 TaxID=3072140 RepID=UPI00280C52B3|nr:CHAT domain-containing protein [Streptomyces sp. LHD-70]MDQ8705364.1 CHAT domain-containing protein [Streptomyces sp. LHD-70]
MSRGIRRRIAVGALAVLAAAVGGVWGHRVVQHRLFRFGPHDHVTYDAELNALYHPGLGAWRDLDTGLLHRYTPDSPLMPYVIPLIGTGCLAFLVLAVNWTLVHRRLVGHAWRECLRRPGSLLLALGMWVPVLLGPYLLKAEVVEALFDDRTTGLFVAVSFGSLLAVVLLVYVPWLSVRGFGTITLLRRLFRALGASSHTGGREEALRAVARDAERFRLHTAARDLDSLAALVRMEAHIGLLADRGSDAELDDLLRDGPAALGAPPRHLMDRVLSGLARPAAAVNVARAFILRYEWTGAVVNLDRAVTVLAPLAARPRPWFWGTATNWPLVHLTLAWALKDRYELRGERPDLDQALALARRVSARHPARARSRLIDLELIRYRATADPAALAAAVREGRSGAPTPGAVLALLERYDRDGDPQDRDEARELAARLVAERGPGHPQHAVCLTVQAQALDVSGERDAAVQCLREAVGDAASPLQTRLGAAVRLGELGAGGPLSVEGYGAAVELLPQMAWIGLRRDDQRWLLSRWSGVSTAAAAAAIADGRVAYAVEILERGRAVMWGQLARLRGGVEAARTADAALERRLAEIRAELDVPDDGTGRGDQAGADVERRIRLGREWDELSARLEKSERRGYRDLTRAADHGPVVVVNAGPQRCDAIILLPDHEPVLVPLDRLDHAELVDWATQSADPDGRHQALLNVIAPRLWDDLAVPVLAALTPHLGADRRVWWCPTGPLAALPIHAAGHHARPGGPALLDEVVSSYTPTIGALLRSTERTVAARGRLVVAAPQAPGRPGLPEVRYEAEEFLRYFPDAVPLDPAHVADVLARLRDAHWVHFACHADASGLAVADGVVSLDQLADLRLTDAEFCYLSACSTAAPDPRAYDEAIHLAALLHLQSYIHVVGTLWEVDSGKALLAAREVYRTLTAHGAPDSTHTARAVHNAAQTLRRDAPRHVDVWSSLLHIGP